MFGIGVPELLVILLVALVVLGPKRLPEVAKGLGKALGEFRRATSDLSEELSNAQVLLEEETRQAQRETHTTPRQAEAPAAPQEKKESSSGEPQ